MNALAERIEEAMRDYWFHPRLSWSEWPTAGEYIAARLEGRVGPPPDKPASVSVVPVESG